MKKSKPTVEGSEKLLGTLQLLTTLYGDEFAEWLLDNRERLAKEWVADSMKREMECQMVCGDGTGRKPKFHVPGCPRNK